MHINPETLLAIFKQHPTRPVALRELLDTLDAPRSRGEIVLQVLMELVRDGRLVRLRKNYFILPAPARTVQGEINVSARGKGFLLGGAADGSDLFIDHGSLGSAIDGDRVEAEVFSGRRGDEGRVTRVIERAHEFIVGQYSRFGPGVGAVTPRNPKIGRSVEIPKSPSRSELPDGAWVRVRVAQWPLGADEPLVAEIVEKIGLAGERGVSILALLRDMGIDPEFSPEVLSEAKRFASPPGDEDLSTRRDLRDETILTIDPATAKDFDDALSIEWLDGEKTWRLGVHIADVAQYVAPGTSLDDEALARATSIYPVDRVVAMLPERLSEDLCSLRPNEDRFAVSCFMEIDAAGRVLRHELAESIIRSRRRLNYGEVQEFFDASEEKRAEFAFADDVGNELLALRDVARALNRMRMERGALDLDMPEIEIACDAGGDVTTLGRHERHESNRLVEECMLIANETVAERLRLERLPVLYRVHAPPDVASLERQAAALELFGVRLRGKPSPTPEYYQPIVDRLRRVDGGHIGQRLLLRTLTRAEYSPKNQGHFGLASECYCHFTSPIRRYPDLMVHRLIKGLARGVAADEKWLEAHREGLAERASQCNRRAELAEETEREAGRIKAMEFMKDLVGDVFEAWISGIARRGFFVELVDYPVEGFVEARTIEGDFFAPDEDRVRLIGSRTGRVFRLAQRVRVRLIRTRELEGEMDVELVESAPERMAKAKAREKKKKKKR